ncbi:MAG: hypothetical protein LBD60_00805 [Puniceicoccales bacterium]|jgi:hypothetical protein|nr:hypothetical protein [Puniceicoccales bacterium]
MVTKKIVAVILGGLIMEGNYIANGAPVSTKKSEKRKEFQTLKKDLENPKKEVQLLGKLGITKDGLDAKTQARAQAICDALLPVCGDDGLLEDFATQISGQARAFGQDGQMGECLRLASLSSSIHELGCSAKGLIYHLSSQDGGQRAYALVAFGAFVERVKTIRDISDASCPIAFVTFYDQICQI